MAQVDLSGREPQAPLRTADGTPLKAALARASRRAQWQALALVLPLLLFILASIYHMQLGIRNIVDDYIHGDHAKEWTLAANLFFCFVVGTACVYAVMRLSFL